MQYNSLRDETTPSTEYFRDLVRKPRKGSLKLYTTRTNPVRLLDAMVIEGKRLLAFGLDVVLALDEDLAHADFPDSCLVPPKEIIFKKSRFLEVNYEAILRRSPEIVIVDNLLHVNASESGMEMRYHDVKNLLDQGVSVISSAYSMYGTNLKNALDHVCGNFTTPMERWANLPADDIVAFIFTPKESFHHAEVRSTDGVFPSQ